MVIKYLLPLINGNKDFITDLTSETEFLLPLGNGNKVFIAIEPMISFGDFGTGKFLYERQSLEYTTVG